MKFHRASLLTFVLIVLSSPAWSATLSLQECLQKARDNHPALKSAVWDTRLAQENIRQASSGFYPRLGAQAG